MAKGQCLYPADRGLGPGTEHLYYGDIIRIRGDDCKIVYIVRDKVWQDPEVWEAEWPD